MNPTKFGISLCFDFDFDFDLFFDLDALLLRLDLFSVCLLLVDGMYGSHLVSIAEFRLNSAKL